MKKTLLSILVLAGIIALVVILLNTTKETDPNLEDIALEANQVEAFADIKDLMMLTLKEGEGEVVANGQTAVVHYIGTLVDGTVFDSSLTRGTPFEFVVGAGQVISGWDIGVAGMKVGEQRRLIVPPTYGYGDRQVGPIPANSVLLFDVELLEIK